MKTTKILFKEIAEFDKENSRTISLIGIRDYLWYTGHPAWN